jgi:hypothetical protein
VLQVDKEVVRRRRRHGTTFFAVPVYVARTKFRTAVFVRRFRPCLVPKSFHFSEL